ncbi:MAG: GTPase domain-containing protein [Myxococcales bacterium]|nr:GTPase domain-containing protein [Myxococcales bacterium]
MPTLNPHTRELSFKLVFYGPGLGGKTTTLQSIFGATEPEHRGKMVSVATQQDRTLHFDYLPVRAGLVRGVTTRLQLYTVPGQLYYDATRRLVLSNVDGVVFVADSQRGRMDANQEALDDLRENLEKLERPLEGLPHTFHWNKRDLTELVPVEELEARFNRSAVPSRCTVALTGEGVMEGLETLVDLVVAAYDGHGEARSEPRPASQPGVVAAPSDVAAAPAAPASRGGSPAQREASIPPRERGSGPVVSPLSTSLLESDPELALEPPSDDEGKRVTVAPRAFAPEAGTAVSAQLPARVIVRPAAPVSSLPPVPSPPGSSEAGLTFVHMFPSADEREVVERLEAQLARGDAHAALLSAEIALSRLLATVGAAFGGDGAPKEPALAAYLLGLDGRRFSAFRAVVRATRRGDDVGLAQAFEGYLLLLEGARLREEGRAER